MADIGSFFTSTVVRRLIPKVSDLILTRNELLKYLKKSKCIHFGKGGDGFDYRVRSTRSTIGGSTSDWGTRTFATTQPWVKLTGAYCQYTWNLAVSLLQMHRNQNADDTSKMFNMVAEQLNELRQSATYQLAQHAYTGKTVTYAGDKSTPIDGLDDIISATNTYGGVDRSVAAGAYLRAQVNTVAKFTADTDGIGVNDGLQSMDLTWMSCSKGKQVGDSIPTDVAVEKDAPDSILCDAASFRAYKWSLMPQYRYTADAANPEKELAYATASITWDEVCAAYKMYFLNRNHLSLDIIGQELLKILVERDEPNPVCHIWVLGTQAQFYSREPRYLGLLNITAP